MSSLAGPLHAAAVVLVLAGWSKLARPATARAALRAVGLPSGRPAVGVLAAIEVVIAGTVLLGTGRAAAAALACLHLGFLAVALRLRRQAAGCGCFGEPAPVTATHLAVNLAVAGLGIAAAAGGDLPSLGAAVGGTPAAGVPYALLVGTLAAAEVVCLTALAELQAAGARP
jgi:hypothetical protein